MKLIISPHVDDDILGCGGILDKDSKVLYCGVDQFHVVSRDERILEATKAHSLLGSSFEILKGTTVNRFKEVELVDQISEVINKFKPSKIFIPYPSYNQDHRTVYNASLIALRPHDHNYFVKKVLVFEQPHVWLWNHSNMSTQGFCPNYFVPIDIEKKIEAYQAMKSQLRSFRSPALVKSLAVLRGAQGGTEFAEGFTILR